MNQLSLSPAHLEFQLSSKRTRKLVFLEEMNRVVPWASLEALIEPHYPKGVTGRPLIGIATMLRVHFMQQWFGLSGPAMEEALHDTPIYRQFISRTCKIHFHLLWQPAKPHGQAQIRH